MYSPLVISTLSSSWLCLKSFSVSIIEHTQGETTLTSKKIGDTVNLENDVIGKYVQKMFAGTRNNADSDNINKGISLDFLESNGF